MSMRILLVTASLLLALCSNGFAMVPTTVIRQDTTLQDTLNNDTLFVLDKKYSQLDSVFVLALTQSITQNPSKLAEFPGVGLQQFLKANAPGVYIQESTGEPGALQQMYIRGTAMPLLTKRDIYQTQPLVVLDGIPLISDEHPFAFDIQNYTFNRVGTATNLLSHIDMNNIARVEVLKDLSGAAMYGPMGANGVIILTSKNAGNKKRISFNSYVGFAQRPSVTTINGEYENDFRKQFYDRYTSNGRYTDNDVYPLYLSDSLNSSYYGPSNWTDSYYRNALVHNISADISGGSDRANFRFSAGNMKSQGVADETALNRYSVMFNINIKPLKWLLFSAMVNGNRLERDRNRSMRDRFSQMNYIPDLSSPLAPNNEVYKGYLSKFGDGFDDNFNNTIQGHGILTFTLGSFSLKSRLAVDYNEGYRDLFYARTLLEDNSYASNYYGFNQRLIFDNVASYNINLKEKHHVNLELGQSIQWDFFKYNNAYAYKGVNDFIKINLIESDPNNENYLNPLAFPRELVYKFLDRTRQNIFSFHGRADYAFEDKYSLSLLLRADGSSNAQPTSRWFISPVLSLGWNIKSDLLSDHQQVSRLHLRASVGRLGRLNAYDNFSQGPQYTADIGFTGNLTMAGYNGFAILSRPYTFGWVGYGIPWAYTEQLNLGVDFGFRNDRFRGSLDVYTKHDKNQLLGMPSYAEYGYSQAYEVGMNVRNVGAELLFSADVLKSDGKSLGWTSTLNFGFNENRLTALPGGADQIIIGDRLLRVGEPIDKFWLLENEGIYMSDAEVPVIEGQALAFNGIQLRGGDPRWRDVDGNHAINYKDKTLQGNIMPRIAGGFLNEFSYKKISLGLNFYYNLGRYLINEDVANRFNFINREGTTEISSVKEITFWEKRGDYTKYPIYNPWSPVIAYRSDQDLFLEDASFLKLRTVSVSYDVTEIFAKRMKFDRVYLYASAHNLFTLTSYSGQDPELVDYTGYDSGYGMPIPRTYTLGVKVNL